MKDRGVVDSTTISFHLYLGKDGCFLCWDTGAFVETYEDATKMAVGNADIGSNGVVFHQMVMYAEDADLSLGLS